MLPQIASPAPRNQAPLADLELPSEILVRRIFFPTDLSPEADLGLAHARLLAEWQGAALSVCHVVPEGPPSTIEAERARRAAVDAHEHLDLRVAGMGAPVQVDVVPTGDPVPEAILAALARFGADLVVLPVRGHTLDLHTVRTSVAGAILDRAARPVLCVREPDHGTALPWRRILVPTDLTWVSGRAFPLAASLARTFNAEVLVIHVSDVMAPAHLSDLAGMAEAQPSEAEVLAFARPHFRGVPVSAWVPGGHTAHRILDLARVQRVDAIVLSSHGHHGLRDRLGGTHAEELVRRAPCPVLIA